MNYAISVLGQRNYCGAFESLLGTVKSYAPYVVTFFDVIKYWSEDDLYDRKLFLDFVKEKVPDLSSIRGQDYLPKLQNKKPSAFVRLFNLCRFVLLGVGVMNYNNWGKRREYRAFIKEKLKDSLIDRYVAVEPLLKLFYENKIDVSIINDLIKLNEILIKVNNAENR
jgi:hypothetical protein